MAIYPSGKTEADIEKVYKIAYEETKIIYPKKINLFSPRLKNLNHVRASKGVLKKHILTKIADILFGIYEGLRTALKKIIKSLFPRRDIIYGKVKDAYITGIITFAKIEDSATPIHNMHIELWARKKLGGWRKLAKGFTNKDGDFKLEFDFMETRKFKYKKFYLEIDQTTHVYFDKETKEAKPKNVVFERILIKKSEFSGMGYDLGKIQLFFWEYRNDSKIPRVVIKDHDEDAPEFYPNERNVALAEQFIPVEIIKDEHLALLSIDPWALSIPKIQHDYPMNLTVKMEELLPYSTRCDYWFGRRMMNGMNCATFEPDTKKKNHYWVKYFGACGYEVNEKYAFPTAEALFKISETGLPLPIKIILTGPINKFEKDPFQKHEFHPNEGERWEHAKRAFRVSGALSTELDDHFAGTHLNTEQYAIAARRNLRKNPIADLLMPHLKEVSLIDHSADSILIGKEEGYIPKASALTAKGIVDRLEDILGVQDWKKWKPMKHLSGQHTYAIAENLFWDIVGEFIDYFFKENIDEIKEEWYEIFCFSNDLVKNSVPLFLSNVDNKVLSPEEKERNEERAKYYHQRYRFDTSLNRVKIKSEIKSVSPITQNEFKPQEGDIENLKSACKYAIMMATFMHTYINEHQYEDIGEILYCSLGLRFGDSKDGILLPEEDYTISPDLIRSTQMLWFSNLLSRTEYGFITRNEENDVNPYFSDLLKAKKEEFAKLNVIADNIESRANI